MKAREIIGGDLIKFNENGDWVTIAKIVALRPKQNNKTYKISKLKFMFKDFSKKYDKKKALSITVSPEKIVWPGQLTKIRLSKKREI